MTGFVVLAARAGAVGRFPHVDAVQLVPVPWRGALGACSGTLPVCLLRVELGAIGLLANLRLRVFNMPSMTGNGQ